MIYDVTDHPYVQLHIWTCIYLHIYIFWFVKSIPTCVPCTHINVSVCTHVGSSVAIWCPSSSWACFIQGSLASTGRDSDGDKMFVYTKAKALWAVLFCLNQKWSTIHFYIRKKSSLVPNKKGCYDNNWIMVSTQPAYRIYTSWRATVIGFMPRDRSCYSMFLTHTF